MTARLSLFALALGAVLAPLALACGSTTQNPAGSDASADSGYDATGGQDAGSDAQSTDCNGTTCKAGEVCVVTTSSGGACQPPDDAGLCPGGKQGTPGQCCDNTTVTYACKALPPSCNGKLACPCADSLCQCDCQISDPGKLACTCLYP
jgi:hypothetical protein